LDSLNQLFDHYQGNLPGASIGSQDGELVYSKGFGKARFDGDTGVTPSTNFCLAFVTKQFTATVILLLREDSLVNLDWTLAEIFWDFPAYGKEITLTRLLQHTSGIKDYEEFVLYTGINNEIMDIGILEIAKQQIAGYFLPGEKYQYSNTAYAILAMVVEKYTGMDFPTFLKERIFDPPGLEKTVAYVRDFNTVPNRAYGYDWIEGR